LNPEAISVPENKNGGAAGANGVGSGEGYILEPQPIMHFCYFKHTSLRIFTKTWYGKTRFCRTSLKSGMATPYRWHRP